MEPKLIDISDLDPVKWDNLVENANEAEVFHLHFYLACVSEDWKVVIIEKEGKYVAGLPIPLKKKYGFLISHQPPFSQVLGPIMRAQVYKNEYSKYKHKREVFSLLINKIPSDIKWMILNLSSRNDYPLPFHWAGYGLKTRYTYQLDLQDQVEDIWMNLKSNLRNSIKKRTDQSSICISKNTDLIKDIIKRNIEKGKEVVPENHLDRFLALVEKAISVEVGELRILKDQSGRILASNFVLKFKGKITYLFGAINPELREQGLAAVLIWDVIEKNAVTHECFDFEGSMIESIESFFRSFSARPIPYLMIEKNKLPLPLRIWTT